MIANECVLLDERHDRHHAVLRAFVKDARTNIHVTDAVAYGLGQVRQSIAGPTSTETAEERRPFEQPKPTQTMAATADLVETIMEAAQS